MSKGEDEDMATGEIEVKGGSSSAQEEVSAIIKEQGYAGLVDYAQQKGLNVVVAGPVARSGHTVIDFVSMAQDDIGIFVEDALTELDVMGTVGL